MTILSAKNLSKTYKMGKVEVRALSEARFSINKGEFVVVMGPSGSGKSTLLHLIGGIDNPTNGEVTLTNQQISGLPDNKITLLRREKIGFIFQFFNLLPTLSAEENIALPFLIDGKKPKEYKNKVDKMLEIVGLTNRKNHKPDELSGGEQQRVSIARALVIEPDIILADEPTGSLDAKTGQEILKLMRQTAKELNQTVVTVTHDVQVAKYADRVVFLKDGKIIGETKLGEKIDATPIIKYLEMLKL